VTYFTWVPCVLMLILWVPIAPAQTNQAPTGVTRATQGHYRTSSSWLYPDTLDDATPTMIDGLIARYPAILEGCRRVSSIALAFQAWVYISSNRSDVTELCVVWAEVDRQGTSEWCMATFYRRPYGPRKGHAEWKDDGTTRSGPEVSLFSSRPTDEQIQAYLSHSHLATELWLRDGWQMIENERYDDNWALAIGTQKVKRATQPFGSIIDRKGAKTPAGGNEEGDKAK